MGGLLLMVGGGSDFYVSIACGINPKKSTCVKKDAKFEETFKIVVRPRDESIVVDLMDQDVVGDDVIGSVGIDIDDDLIKYGFPKKKVYRLTAADGEKSKK